jgi:hypothetical protein
MFNLDREVRSWCRKVTPGLIFRRHQVAELEDHVHCAVAELIEDGASEESAFRTVTSKIGDVCALRSELRKNMGILSHVLHRMALPSARIPWVAATLCAIVVVTLSASLQSDVLAEWAENAMVALYMIPMKWLDGAS